MIPWLEGNMPFPKVSEALTEADGAPGLLAAGGDLSAQRLLQAYRHGIFPWFSEGQPILWWSTDPRMVLFTDEFKLHRSLRKTLARLIIEPKFELRMDTAFDDVIRACSASERPG